MVVMDVLVFSRTGGYRHESIPAGVAALRELAEADGYAITATEDPDIFASPGLGRFAAVVFLSTSDSVLPDPAQRAGLMAHVRDGGGFAAIHGAIATEADWRWYGELIGIRFDGHPEVQPGQLTVTDPDHPATARLPPTWQHTDEWYNYAGTLQPGCRVLLSVDESSYVGGTFGPGHPIAWYHRTCGGPVFVTALGHPVAAYADPTLREHLRGGVRSVIMPNQPVM
jgi:type 1 glutamine amidotransferase